MFDQFAGRRPESRPTRSAADRAAVRSGFQWRAPGASARWVLGSAGCRSLRAPRCAAFSLVCSNQLSESTCHARLERACRKWSQVQSFGPKIFC